ncbi:MAG: four helix bundle protein [Oligoflexus sp.]|nr:four helix bundle protein [Oligoflexus sp.]
MSFSFENLKVYGDSLTFVYEVQLQLAKLGKQCPSVVRNQLTRAAISIALNIPEGNGRWHKAEKRQFFYFSRGSTYECVSILQVMTRMGLLKDEVMTYFYKSLTDTAKMLSALIRSVEDLKRSPA